MKLKEEININKIITDLQGDFSGSNEDQMRGVQLLKGLAISDDSLANNFMKLLDRAITQIAQKILTKDIKLDTFAIMREEINKEVKEVKKILGE